MPSSNTKREKVEKKKKIHLSQQLYKNALAFIVYGFSRLGQIFSHCLANDEN